MHIFPPQNVVRVATFNFLMLLRFVEDSEDAKQLREKGSPDHTAVRTPPSTPVKPDEGMSFGC